MIEVREAPGRGRGVFALQALPPGTLVMRALPGAAVLNTNCLKTHCCVCLSPLEADVESLCGACGAACLCRRCSREPGPQRIHGDECALLKLLEATPLSERPADTTTLRMLARLLMWRWRARTQPEASQHHPFHPLRPIVSHLAADHQISVASPSHPIRYHPIPIPSQSHPNLIPISSESHPCQSNPIQSNPIPPHPLLSPAHGAHRSAFTPSSRSTLTGRAVHGCRWYVVGQRRCSG